MGFLGISEVKLLQNHMCNCKLIYYIDLNDIFVYSAYILSYKQTNMVHFPKLKRARMLMNFVGKKLMLLLLVLL